MSLSGTNSTGNEFQIAPFVDPYVDFMIDRVVGLGLTLPTAACGIFTNVANICVYLRMGIKETTQINFFALSVFDLLVCICAVVAEIFTNDPIISMKMPYSGVKGMEFGLGAIYLGSTFIGCSTFVTAVLSVERYLCIATPLKVKQILTPPRTRAMILIFVTYQSVFLVLFFSYPGPCICRNSSIKNPLF